MIYTVTLNPAIDYVVWMDHFCEGKTNLAKNAEVQLGGKGINVSMMLAHLGVKSCAMGFLAGFTGQVIEDGLQKIGVDTDFVHLKEGINRINIKLKAGQESEINANAPEVPQWAREQLLEKLEQLKEGDVLVLAGSVPKSLPTNIYEQMLQRVENKKVLTVVDATGDFLCSALKYRPFLIKPNHLELGEIFGKSLSGRDEVQECAAKLQKMGAQNVLVSMAGEGAILLDENGVFHQIDAPEGTVVNSVGAGDSMVAGFLMGYLKNRDYEQALRIGTAAGSATAFSERLAKKEEVNALLERIEQNRI